MTMNVSKEKISKYYLLSVEGETEKWYFERLKYLINTSVNATCKVDWSPKVEKSPYDYAKRFHGAYPIDAFHICDYESNDSFHVEQFRKTIKELKDARKIKRNIKYELGYSNYTFDLWMILHKIQFHKSVTDRTKYIKGINLAYHVEYKTLKEYKEEKNFKRLLSTIEIEDVKRAITNANAIRSYHEGVEHILTEDYGFKYYKDNPDLTINKCVENIFRICGLL